MGVIYLEELETIKYLIKIIFISVFTLKLNYKFLSYTKTKVLSKDLIALICGDIICTIIQYISNSTISIVFLNIFIAFVFSRVINKNIGYALLVTTISLSINFILYLTSVIINFVIFYSLNFNNKAIIFILILLIYSILFKIICSIKRFKKQNYIF